jgi:hypothetical protein
MNTTPEFDSALVSWLSVVEGETKAYFARSFPSLSVPTFTLETGQRYIRVVVSRGGDSGRSVHSFIDKTNGDILKAASWKAPAKHARGNIFSDIQGLDGKGSIAYLR